MKRISFFAAMAMLLLASCTAVAPSPEASCLTADDAPRVDLLLLGEIHGTVESPELAGKIVCSYAKRGPVALGLEISMDEQKAIDEYLVSDGGTVARKGLLAGLFWRAGKDGRASVAMAALIERMRELKSKNMPVSVFAFDAQTASGLDRDAALAKAIRDFRSRNPGLPIVALMGNVHASLEPMQFGEKKVVTTGALLSDAAPTSLLLAAKTGTAWVCMPECSAHEMPGKWADARARGFVGESPQSGYTAAYVLPASTASPPATQ